MILYIYISHFVTIYSYYLYTYQLFINRKFQSSRKKQHHVSKKADRCTTEMDGLIFHTQ